MLYKLSYFLIVISSGCSDTTSHESIASSQEHGNRHSKWQAAQTWQKAVESAELTASLWFYFQRKTPLLLDFWTWCRHNFVSVFIVYLGPIWPGVHVVTKYLTLYTSTFLACATLYKSDWEGDEVVMSLMYTHVNFLGMFVVCSFVIHTFPHCEQTRWIQWLWGICNKRQINTIITH